MKTAGVIVLIFVIAAISAVTLISTKALLDSFDTLNEAKQKCLERGYPGVEYAGRKFYCVGIRDGNSVVVPLEDLVERSSE